MLAASSNNSLGIVGVTPDAQRTFIVCHTLQSVPDPERADVVFGGWYPDD